MGQNESTYFLVELNKNLKIIKELNDEDSQNNDTILHKDQAKS